MIPTDFSGYRVEKFVLDNPDDMDKLSDYKTDDSIYIVSERLEVGKRFLNQETGELVSEPDVVYLSFYTT